MVDSEKVFYYKGSPIHCPKIWWALSHKPLRLRRIIWPIFWKFRIPFIAISAFSRWSRNHASTPNSATQVRKLTVHVRNLVVPTPETWDQKLPIFEWYYNDTWVAYQNLVKCGPQTAEISHFTNRLQFSYSAQGDVHRTLKFPPNTL